MSWASVILAGLQLLNSLMKWAMEKQAIRTGEEKQIAREALALLQQTQDGKELRDRVKRLDDSESGDLWDRMTKV